MARLEVFRPSGRFDEAEARRLVDAVARCGPDAVVRVDLGGADDIQDHELALLAQGLAGCGRAVTLHGLTRHHLLVLRYLGYGPASTRSLVPPATAAAALAGAPEAVG